MTVHYCPIYLELCAVLIYIVQMHTYRSTIKFADPRPTRCHTPFTSWLFHVQPFGFILKTSIYPNPGIIIYHWVYTLISIRYDCWLNFNNYPIHLILLSNIKHPLNCPQLCGNSILVTMALFGGVSYTLCTIWGVPEWGVPQNGWKKNENR